MCLLIKHDSAPFPKKAIMDLFYYSVNIDGNRTLCLSPLTDRLISLCGQQINDASGYFLYERRTRGDVVDVEVIAQLLSDEAAARLRQALNMT
jgi:hypothetical protein